MDFPVLNSAAVSETGPVRAENQDAVGLPDPALSPERGYLFVVADGMGGYANGALASVKAVETLAAAVYERIGAPGQAALRQGVERANLAIYRAAQQLEARMGTTLTAALVVGRTLHLAHVGDSRAYLVRGPKAQLLTSDHTQVGELVRARVIAPGLARTHPQRSILTRALGLGLFVQPELSRVELQPHDRLLLCSDGLWSALEDEELGRLVSAAHSPAEASRQLVELALQRGTDDNLTALSIFVEQLPGGAAARPAGWLSRLNPWKT